MTQFDQLVIDLCRLIGYPTPQHLIAGDAVCYEGMNFALASNAESEPDAVLLIADFGSLDIEKKAMLYPLMLKENFMMRGLRNCTFGVCESSDSVVLIDCLSLATTTPDALQARMRSLAHKTNYFNKQHRRLHPAAYRSNTAQSAALRSHYHASCTV